jgi:predicted phosphodiesterase
MRLAALYDIHGNLPALEAVLDEIRDLAVDQIVVGGDVLPGPMPTETLERLIDMNVPVQFIHGNGELAVLAQIGAPDPASAAYWGTTSGQPLSEDARAVVRWTADQLRPDDQRMVASWPKTLRVDVPEFGRVLFCHGTPRSELEIFTRLTREALLLPVFEGLDAALVVCGHTHMQFDRMIGKVRVVNAGSVGMPFGEPGADWLLLGPDVQLRHTTYNLAAAAERIRATRYPHADDFAANSVLRPPREADMLKQFTHISFP